MMEKLSMCTICLIKNVRMDVVTNKSLLKMYGKLADVPCVSKPILACFFCCTRLKQCCQLQRKCMEAKELLAQMSEDYEEHLTNQGALQFVGGFIITPIKNMSIVDECQLGSDANKQELPANCEEQDIKLAHLSKELDSENVCDSYPDIEASHSSVSEEVQFVIEIKIEEEDEHELYKNQRVTEMERAAITTKPRLKNQLEDTIAAKQTVNVLSDLEIIRSTNSRPSESVAKIKESITTTSQSNFSPSSNVIQGNRIHASEKPFTCDICQRSFSLKRSLIYHFRTHTGDNRYKCDVCQHSFPLKRSLIYHIRTHIDEKPFKCDVCQRSFCSDSTLLRHQRIHSGEKPFKCDVCLRSFTERVMLHRHNLIHTGEKPHKCDICQRSFSIKSNLNRHMRLHSEDRPFKCDVCLRSCPDKYTLIKHSLIHTGEKPYKCDICQRSFGLKSYLKKHSRIHTDRNPSNEM